jgi:hypothetical protein
MLCSTSRILPLEILRPRVQPRTGIPVSDTDRSQTVIHNVETQASHEVIFLFLLRLLRALRRVQNVHGKRIRVYIAKYRSASFSHADVLIVISLAYMLLI